MSQRATDLLAAKAAPRDSARFIRHLAHCTGRGRLLAALILPVIAGLLGLPVLWLTAFLIAVILQPTPQIIGPYVALGLILGLTCLRLALDYAGGLAATHSAAATRVALRHRLYNRLLHEGPAFTTHSETGALTTTLVERVEALDGYISRFMPQRMVAFCVPPVFLLCFAGFDWVIALELAGLVLCLPVFFALFGFAAHRASLKQFTALERMSGLFLDRLRQLPLLRIMGAVEREAVTMEAAANEFRSRTMKVLRLAFLSTAGLDLVVALGVVLVALRVGHTLGSGSPKIDLHTGLFLLLATPEFFAPFRALSASYHDRASALAAVEPLQQLLEKPQTHLLGRRPLPEDVRQLSLEFCAVDFTYPGRHRKVLSRFNLRIAAGEFVAITGPSGAGKSTILALLMGFICPDDGSIALGQEQLDALDSEARARLFSWVGQRTHIFYGTLYDNIRLGVDAADEGRIYAAACKAGLGPLLETLPEGLHTLIGERGFGLSGGEAQRVALARAFLRDTPFLLLDEPTTGLDRDTATALLETIRTLATGCSVILVSHDPLALGAAHRIITLEGAAYVAA